ncbi:MAG: nucleotidyltransferase domain-containing protein [Deltaproteobacteria bacterium]|nr:nucleotidyltransferase domain-containing protein [Deltaproteobacteria bacterium]
MPAGKLKASFDKLLERVVEAAKDHYGDRLVTVAVFGSVGRRSQRHDSDVDLLLICDHLPSGRMRRIADFQMVEDRVSPFLASLERQGIFTCLSPILKTPAEVERGGLIFLDMLEDARLLYDRDDFFRHFLDRLRSRLRKLGARRIWRGNAWYWDLKPDFKPGDIFEL